MATVVFSALGAGLGSSIGGSLLGLSMTAVGRFAGAMIGRSIDNRLSAGGGEIVESGKLDRIRMSSVGEGVPIPMVFGRTRMSGQIIWASQFKETIEKAGGGKASKGAPAEPTLKTYKYSVSLALSLCPGEISDVARVWADGVEVAKTDLNMRIYKGTWDQDPDPKIEAIEGKGHVPAYRGMAYVVFEDLSLYQFGNRIPQFSFEVCRPAQENGLSAPETSQIVEAVALIPGSGEYALASQSVSYDFGDGLYQAANQHSASKRSDFATSLDMLTNELPKCKSTSLIVSWFGNDLRCARCEIAPKVEHKQADSKKMPWRVSGVGRADAETVSTRDGDPLYGGTPTDQSVVQSIKALKDQDQDVMFYPFILMDQKQDNDLVNPYQPSETQPALPWRGRITLNRAPGVEGTTDRKTEAEAEVSAFFGTVLRSDFRIEKGDLIYSGPNEWSYRRFVLHYAWLCKLAGGVHAFCIGSELRGLTQIRGLGDSFPAVEELVSLARDVRAILGGDTKIGYAADWSEYFGYHPIDGSGDLYFHLDPLWADDAIDFVGIDNYMPLSDWRDGDAHLDANFGSIYDLEYLKSNIEGGEGFDWYYASDQDRIDQIRTPIEDGYYQEPWVWRYKDIRSWWQNEHFERRNGQRLSSPTSWVAQSKPIWFTEIGCAALDKATNQPNKFIDPKSSESEMPYFSNGNRDELMQMAYLQAMTSYWKDGAKNPISHVYNAPMLDTSKSFVWAWDARPYPWFPNASGVWSDGPNYERGHWVNGRSSAQSLASVLAEICIKCGVTSFDVSQAYGFVRGYDLKAPSDGRSMIQPLVLRYGIDISEQNGVLIFRTRNAAKSIIVDPNSLVDTPELDSILSYSRNREPSLVGRVQLTFSEADGDFEIVSEETVLPDQQTTSIAQNEMPLVMTRSEGQQTIQRWLNDAQMASETVKFALPLSLRDISVGTIFKFRGDEERYYRVDHIEREAYLIVQATRCVATESASHYQSFPASLASQSIAQPVEAIFLDLPQITETSSPHAPYVAASARPWTAPVALYKDQGRDEWELDQIIGNPSTIGKLLTALTAGPIDRIDTGRSVEVQLREGTLSSVSRATLLSGGNRAAIGHANGVWEVMQFKTAELIAPKTYRLSGLVRGQFGTNVEMPHKWDAGTQFVLLDDNIEQLTISESDLGVENSYLFGPTSASFETDVYRSKVTTFQGIGLRPLSPCHVTATVVGNEIKCRWIRRGRVSADRWWDTDIPITDDGTVFDVVLGQGTDRLLQQTVTDTKLRLMLPSASVANGPLWFSVAQVSSRYGSGPSTVCAVQ